MTEKVFVEPFTTESLAPKITDPDIVRLLPKKGQHPIRAACVIRGINSAIANGIRRVILSEMENYALMIDQESWRTDDAFQMIDFITRRVLGIPITRALVKLGMKFSLDATNDSDEPLDITTAHLLPMGSNSSSNAFYETIVITTIQPHKSIHFVAEVVSGIDDAVFSTAFTAISIPIDERPADIINPTTGVPKPIVPPLVELPYQDKARVVASSGISNPRVFQLVFETVGKGTPEEIVKRAVQVLIARTKAILTAPVVRGRERQAGSSSAQAMGVSIADSDAEGLYTIKMPGETHTIGILFTKSCTDVFPNIDFVSTQQDDFSSEMMIRVRTLSEPIEKVIGTTVQYIIDKLEAIMSFL